MPEHTPNWDDLPRNLRAGGLAGHRVGDGPALVLIHGVGLRLEAWNAMIPTLARHFTVYAMDMPGHGQSDAPTGDTVDSFSRAFDPLLEVLDAPIYCAGHSMGAMIAIDLATRHKRFAGVAALNAIYRRTEAAQSAVMARAQTLKDNGNPDPTATLDRWFGPNPTDATAAARDACRHWLTGANPLGYAAAYRAFASHDGPSDGALRTLDCPTIFVTGADEPNSTPAMSHAMAQIVPNGQARIIECAAHMAPMTHGVEIARYLTSFFEGKWGDS